MALCQCLFSCSARGWAMDEGRKWRERGESARELAASQSVVVRRRICSGRACGAEATFPLTRDTRNKGHEKSRSHSPEITFCTTGQRRILSTV